MYLHVSYETNIVYLSKRNDIPLDIANIVVVYDIINGDKEELKYIIERFTRRMQLIIVDYIEMYNEHISDLLSLFSFLTISVTGQITNTFLNALRGEIKCLNIFSDNSIEIQSLINFHINYGHIVKVLMINTNLATYFMNVINHSSMSVLEIPFNVKKYTVILGEYEMKHLELISLISVIFSKVLY